MAPAAVEAAAVADADVTLAEAFARHVDAFGAGWRRRGPTASRRRTWRWSRRRGRLVTAGFEVVTAAARARGPADLSKVTVRVGGTQEDAGAKEGVAAVTAAAEGEEEEGASAVPAVRIAVISTRTATRTR